MAGLCIVCKIRPKFKRSNYCKVTCFPGGGLTTAKRTVKKKLAKKKAVKRKAARKKAAKKR